jgi:predicted transcriptional regulator
MKTAKQELREAVDGMPDDVSPATALTLREWASVLRGLADIERGDVIDDAELGERLKRWRSSEQRRLWEPILPE